MREATTVSQITLPVTSTSPDLRASLALPIYWSLADYCFCCIPMLRFVAFLVYKYSVRSTQKRAHIHGSSYPLLAQPNSVARVDGAGVMGVSRFSPSQIGQMQMTILAGAQ